MTLTSSPEFNGSAIEAQGSIHSYSKHDGAFPRRASDLSAFRNADTQPYLTCVVRDKFWPPFSCYFSQHILLKTFTITKFEPFFTAYSTAYLRESGGSLYGSADRTMATRAANKRVRT